MFVGYLAWLFGIFGAHRFYYGKPVSGIIWLFTLGLCGIGWLVDLVLIPDMDEEASRRFAIGETDYTLTWILLLIGGAFGIHRFYMGDIFWGVLYLISGGLLGIGIVYDVLTLNEQISRQNYASRSQIVYR